jgi:ABC-type transport system substrate-binding protein
MSTLVVNPAHAQAASAAPPAGQKVLRYAFEVAETSLDPARTTDLYSHILTAHIFEGLYEYDYLARPVKIRPLTADGMPQSSPDFRVWTIKVKPGIYFADDPAFKGKKRELVAQDYVYGVKRFADPANLSPVWTDMEADGIQGLAELRKQALDTKKPFDYDKEIPGIRALDKYTLQFTLAQPRPRYLQTLAGGEPINGMAREVVEMYGDQVAAHPVGTGPFKLAEWRRSSFLAFDRNPGYRERYYDAEPADDDAEGQALLAKFKGRRLPMLDRVEISIVEEEQPRWLSFVNGEADFAYRVGYQFVTQAMPGGKVAPNLAKRGIRGYQITEPAGNFYYFNLDDPVIGGYTPEKVALRRAMALGMNTKRVIDYAYSDQGTVSQGPVMAYETGYDPKFKSEFGDYDPARARALLDLYGYKDRDGDGWREMPDGSPLVITIATQADQRSRKISEVMDKDMRLLGVRVVSKVAQWPENLKSSQAGTLQMWTLGLFASAPDPEGAFSVFDSKQIGGQNQARIRLPQLDELYHQIQLLPDGPERQKAIGEAIKLAIAYMPYKYTVARMSIDMSYPQLVGYRRPVFWQNWWEYVDIDNSLRKAR